MELYDVRVLVCQVFHGATHSVQKQLLGVAWSPNGERVAAASANGNCVIWNLDSTAVLYDLPGHGKGGAIQV